MRIDVRFIAEPDEFGGIQWVWLYGCDQMPSRPIKDLAEVQKMKNRNKCHGASYEAMLQWVEETRGAH